MGWLLLPWRRAGPGALSSAALRIFKEKNAAVG